MFAVRRWFTRQRLSTDVESQRSLLDGSSASSNDGASTISTTARKDRNAEFPRGKRVTKRCRLYFRIIAAFQAFILIVSAVVVEGTININNLDMNRGDFRTSSQLMAFVVGIISAVPVFWECLIMAPMRWVMSKRKKSNPLPATWYGRPTRLESVDTLRDLPPIPPVPPVPQELRMTSANVV
ncbi:unnamed protein product [Parascedosporium putredinis]|uniref:Uncharacterized protein n=1 Tax=Parascedosporium putredinis TaxID=1442378 RepID=A0A9P1H9E9_9PEZI|nr:unnamed protein product [Parascedosporium putredinis]CAI8001575.1 unnamed protein product [Parascedosporium putredinis]